MKRMAILFVGCLPLAALMLWSLFESVPNGPSDEENQAVDAQVAEAHKLADETLARADRDRPAARRLADVESFADQPINPAEAPAATKALDDAMAALQRARKAGQLVAALNGVPLRAPPWPEGDNWGTVALTQAVAVRQRLNLWISEQRTTDLGRIEGAEEVFALLEKRRTQIDKEIEVLTAVQQGCRFFADKKYQEAIAALDKASPDAIGDAANRKRIDALLRRYLARAEYWRERAETPRTIASLESFFTHHPGPPDDLDRQAHGQLRDELAGMKAEAARQKRIGELEAAMASLAKQSSLDTMRVSAVRFRRQLDESADIKDMDKADFRKRARGMIGDWLTSVAFPRKKPTPKLLERDNQEVTASNKRYIGKFIDDGGHFLKFWQWDGEKDPVERPQGDDKVDKIQIAESIKPPHYVQWADYYNDASESLAKGGADANGAKPLGDQWKEFFEKCKKTQDEFDRYQNRWGTTREPDLSCKDWSFLPNPKTLPHHDAADLSRQLEELWMIFQPQSLN